MNTLSDVKKGSPVKPVKFKCVAVSPVRTFTDNSGEQRQMVTCGIAHATESMKANVYGDNINKIKAGRTMILKEYSVNKGTLVIRAKAKLFTSGKYITNTISSCLPLSMLYSFFIPLQYIHL